MIARGLYVDRTQAPIVLGIDPGKTSGWCALQGKRVLGHGTVAWSEEDGVRQARDVIDGLRRPAVSMVLAIEDQFRANVSRTQGGWEAIFRMEGGCLPWTIERVSVSAWRARMVGPMAVNRGRGGKTEPAVKRALKASLQDAYVELVRRRLRVRMEPDAACAALIALYVIEERGVGRRTEGRVRLRGLCGHGLAGEA